MRKAHVMRLVLYYIDYTKEPLLRFVYFNMTPYNYYNPFITITTKYTIKTYMNHVRNICQYGIN